VPQGRGPQGRGPQGRGPQGRGPQGRGIGAQDAALGAGIDELARERPARGDEPHERRGREERVEVVLAVAGGVEVGELHPVLAEPRGGVEGVQRLAAHPGAGLGQAEGRRRELAYFHQDVTDEGLRAEEGEGAVADGALRFRAEGGPGGAVEVEVPLGEDVLPRAVALYLLPRLAPYLPGDAVELRAFDVADPRAEPRRLRLARAESDGTEARFTLEGDPEVKGIVVRADRITLER